MGGEQRIGRDVGRKYTKAIMHHIAGVFRPEELRDAFDVILEQVEQAIADAFAARARELRRLNPAQEI